MKSWSAPVLMGAVRGWKMGSQSDRTTGEEVHTILVIDDDAATRALHQRLIQRAGFQVLVAEDGKRGIALAEEFHPNVILLDVSLPTVNGYEVCRHLKDQLSTAEIPVVFVTAESPGPETIKLGFDAGADDFLTKPVNAPLLVARLRVILQQQALREAYRQLATRDALTGLVNRRQVFFGITEALMRSKRDGSPSILIMADLDRFKAINDQWGHDFGDEVLVTFARVLQRSTSRQDTAGRIGGEEFAVVLAETTREAGLREANRIREVFSSIVFDADGDAKQFTASLGVAHFEGVPQTFDADQFIKQADVALYAAKTGGRNRAVAFWELDPNNLPVVAPSESHTRERKRGKSDRAYIHADDARASGDASTCQPAASHSPAGEQKS